MTQPDICSANELPVQSQCNNIVGIKGGSEMAPTAVSSRLNDNHDVDPNAPSSPKTENVDAVVTKAKKAASSLWMILHAQVCKK